MDRRPPKEGYARGQLRQRYFYTPSVGRAVLTSKLFRSRKALEMVTHGAVVAASHRVISPPVGSPARYSIPFFQFISQVINLRDMLIDSELILPDIQSIK